MKRILAILALLLMALPLVFAGGAAEIWGGTIGGAGAGASAGAAIGSIIPGLGTAIGAGVGALAGGIAGYFSGQAQKKNNAATIAASEAQEQSLKLQTNQNFQENYLASKTNYNTIVANIDNTKAGILQASANISTYDQAILRWQDQYDIGKQQIQAQGESDYSAVMNNWMDTAAVGSAKGQSGGSADIMANSQKSSVTKLVGEDLLLDETGGTYGTQIREYDLDSESDWAEITQQREIEKASLAKYQDSLSMYKTEFEEAATIRKNATNDYYDNTTDNKDDSGVVKTNMTNTINADRTAVNTNLDVYKDNSYVDAEIERRKKLKEKSV